MKKLRKMYFECFLPCLCISTIIFSIVVVELLLKAVEWFNGLYKDSNFIANSGNNLVSSNVVAALTSSLWIGYL